MGMTKDQVIEKLNEIGGIEFDPEAKYNVLRKLLKDNTQAKPKPLFNTIEKELKKRCKKVGLTKDQVNVFVDAAALVAHLDRISPETNPAARPQAGETPKPKTKKSKVPAKVEFESKLEVSRSTVNRAQFDENNLQAKLREVNRKYGTHHPVKIDSSTSFEPVDGKNKFQQNTKFYVTSYTIFYK